jgi:hypothetical protein
MINFFVETKLEYTTQLVNVLTPLVYEGIQSIYAESLKASNEANNVLKLFQTFLKRIPKWNEEMIKQETERIMNNSKSYSWLPDLVKATIKANIIVLTYNPNCNIPNGYKIQTKVDPKFYQNIKIDDFIHKIYIECARELWNNPYLMYHQYPPIELKRNQRDTIHLVKDSIKEAIRKLLPVKEILELYLGEELEQNIKNDQFERNITEVDERNIQKLIKKELILDQIVEPFKNQTQTIEPFKNQTQSQAQAGESFKEKKNNDSPLNNAINLLNLQKGGDEKKDLESKILDIINKTTSDIKLTGEKSSYVTPKSNKTSESNDTPLTKATKDISSEVKKYNSLEIKNKETIDDKIKNILEKNLGETDLNTSLSYRPETNEKDYQEIFSNNVGDPNVVVKNNNNTVGNDTKEKDSSKSKRKFFNNYLNF